MTYRRGYPVPETSKHLTEIAVELRRAGYMVHKLPPCEYEDKPHGRHSILTKTAICDGKEPFPHGYRGGHMGSFDFWTSCACGYDFNTDDWEAHRQEHKICTCLRRKFIDGVWKDVGPHNPGCPQLETE